MAKGKSQEGGTLGLADVLFGALLFILLAFLARWFASFAVPGLYTETAFVQTILSGLLFLLVWHFLGNSLFKPYIDLLVEREERTVGDEKTAAAIRQESKALSERIEEVLSSSRLEAIRERDALVDQAKKRAQEALDAASARSESDLGTAREKIAAIKLKAEADLMLEADALAALVKERVLAKASNRVIH